MDVEEETGAAAAATGDAGDNKDSAADEGASKEEGKGEEKTPGWYRSWRWLTRILSLC